MQAEEGERLRSTLLSALSHDLRTPLTAIFGAAESMRLNAVSLPPGHIALIDAVREQAGRETFELIERVRQLSVAYRLKQDLGKVCTT